MEYSDRYVIAVQQKVLFETFPVLLIVCQQALLSVNIQVILRNNMELSATER